MELSLTQRVIPVLLFLLFQTGGPVASDQTPETMTRVEVGQSAPGFDLTAADGSTYSLDSLHDKSALILIFFRGAW
jgi:cytochrome oxidase Cu insertion factor (SCO1/SenC/PrrC family)